MSKSSPGDNMPNHLGNELSPYLQQHAHNPVNWYPWGQEAFEKAARDNKPVIISIGYSSCHWCHVMESESFEDDDVAQGMNQNFISIKVDREEHPDVDAHYMNAIQIISGRGGWPLNIFALPDGRAFYGITYYPKGQWLSLLQQISRVYSEDHDSLLKNAQAIENRIETYRESLFSGKPDEGVDLKAVVEKSFPRLDTKEGGLTGAPKFPMPFLLRFLLDFGEFFHDTPVSQFLNLTLEKMAARGLYDQIGGGFARYSTDSRWKIPHFEKMLYDNALLISLYSAAYGRTSIPRYKQVAEESLAFIRREMTSPEGLFYSALDADSQGEEGAYYFWEESELRNILQEDYEFSLRLFGWGDTVYTENGKFIPGYHSGGEEDPRKAEAVRSRLLSFREKRVRPGLDDKSLTDWNALMISAWCDACKAFGNTDYRDTAEKAARGLLKRVMDDRFRLKHSFKEGTAYVEGFLSDYAFLIAALLDLFEISGDVSWLTLALELQNSQDSLFLHKERGFYYSASPEDQITDAILPGFEIIDTVTPSPNSAAAVNLFRLYILTGDTRFRDHYKALLKGMESKIEESPLYFSHWAGLLLKDTELLYELVVTGPEAESAALKLHSLFIPNSVTLFSREPAEDLPPFKGRFNEGKTLIYVCRDNSCLLPAASVEDALALVESERGRSI
ncbi:MAG: thioredoxin domain-containing protein [Spirochaetales bacterium]|nr:thioredoxin domain-containing protein [Spirochaetales bacterium]